MFICVVTPLMLMLLLLKKRSKLINGYLVIGIFASLFISELNSILLSYFNNDTFFVTTTITPVTEEIIKALPIFFYAYVISDDLERLMPIAFSTGIGFAFFENMVVVLKYTSNIQLPLAIARGVSTALMHAVCTAAVGIGMSFVRKKKEFFYCGTFGLLMLAILYHGMFNLLVQSQFAFVGYAIPVLTYIPLVVRQYKYSKNKNDKGDINEKQAVQAHS